MIFIFLDSTTSTLPQKKHKKHKHKKHKRKKLSHEEESYVDVSVDSDLKKTFKVRIKKEEDKR